jgi:hypothetical protein
MSICLFYSPSEAEKKTLVRITLNTDLTAMLVRLLRGTVAILKQKKMGKEIRHLN